MTAAPHAARTARAVPLLAALALAGCSDGPSGPSAEDAELLRAASLSSDSLMAGALGVDGVLPMPGGAGGPVLVGPPTLVGPFGPGGGCRWVDASGRTECGPVTANGLTFATSFAFYDAAGAAQRTFGPTTDRANTRSSMTGTTTFSLRGPPGPGGTVTLTVDRRTDQTTSGLADPSGRRRSDGTAGGTETSVIANERGTVRIDRRFADTTINLVMQIPPRTTLPGVGPGGPPVPGIGPVLAPLSGRIVRVSRIVETPASGAARTTDVRMVTEFLEGGVARTTITVNGTTHVCTQLIGSMRPPECR